jgi:hypothetical protein
MLSRRSLIVGVGASATVAASLGAVRFYQSIEEEYLQSLVLDSSVEALDSRFVMVDGWILLPQDLKVVPNAS